MSAKMDNAADRGVQGLMQGTHKLLQTVDFSTHYGQIYTILRIPNDKFLTAIENKLIILEDSIKDISKTIDHRLGALTSGYVDNEYIFLGFSSGMLTNFESLDYDITKQIQFKTSIYAIHQAFREF